MFVKSMDKSSKEQYMKTLRERYFVGSKKEKTEILNEYCKNTKEDRKHAIKKFNYFELQNTIFMLKYKNHH